MGPVAAGCEDGGHDIRSRPIPHHLRRRRALWQRAPAGLCPQCRGHLAPAGGAGRPAHAAGGWQRGGRGGGGALHRGLHPAAGRAKSAPTPAEALAAHRALHRTKAGRVQACRRSQVLRYSEREDDRRWRYQGGLYVLTIGAAAMLAVAANVALVVSALAPPSVRSAPGVSEAPAARAAAPGRARKAVGEIVALTPPGGITDAVLAACATPLLGFFTRDQAIIVGGAGLAKGGLEAGLAFAERFKLVREGWNGFNVLHAAAGRENGHSVR